MLLHRRAGRVIADAVERAVEVDPPRAGVASALAKLYFDVVPPTTHRPVVSPDASDAAAGKSSGTFHGSTCPAAEAFLRPISAPVFDIAAPHALTGYHELRSAVTTNGPRITSLPGWIRKLWSFIRRRQ